MRSYIQDHPETFVIAGIAHSVGSIKYTNSELCDAFGIKIKPSFIDKSVGIDTRYFVADNETTSDLAAAAAKKALANAGISIQDIDRLIVATSTPDHPTPSTACIVQYKLGGSGFPANDIVAACSGFMYGLDQALRCLATGDKNVLLVGVDCRSRTLNMQDKRTAFLYGDGAGAVVLQRRAGNASAGPDKAGFLDCFLTADGSGHDAVIILAGGAKEPCNPQNVAELKNKLSMPSGDRVAQNALRGFAELVHQLLDRNRLNLSDIKQFVFHQPNRRLLEVVMNQLGLTSENTFINFQHYGNTVAGSIPIALSEAVAANLLNSGDTVVLCGVGGGFTGGAALLKWP